MQDIVEDIVIGYIKKIALERLLAAIPFLAYPPFSWIAAFMISFIIGKLLPIFKTFINFQIRDFSNAAEQADYAKAEALIISLQESTDEKAINDAKAQFEKALIPLVHFNIKPPLH